jgi:hypothetical protein
MVDIKTLVGPGKTVKFVRYRKGELWYVAEGGFEFPVPIEDTGDGEFLAEDRAAFFMRYIRKHLAYIEQARVAQLATVQA